MTEEQTKQIISDFIEYFYQTYVDFKRPNKSEMIKFMEIYLKEKEELDKKNMGDSKEEEPKTPRNEEKKNNRIRY